MTTGRLLKVTLAVSVLIYASLQFYQYQSRLNHIPSRMGVWHILYSEEQIWGMGPGGNETGIIVYGMPKATYNALMAGGMEWLEVISKDNSRGRRRQGVFRKWHRTPSPVATKCSLDPPNRADEPESCSIVGQLLDRYGSIISVDDWVLELANEAMLTEGAYYSHGMLGMLIVIPDKRRLIYAYSG